jgi:hypothetical protein
VYKDLGDVREHYAALRDLISQNPGGREDIATRVKVSVLCEAAIAVLDDALIALEGVNTRLFFLRAMRDRVTSPV